MHTHTHSIIMYLVNNLFEEAAHLLASPISAPVSRDRQVWPEEGNGGAPLVEQLVKIPVRALWACTIKFKIIFTSLVFAH